MCQQLIAHIGVLKSIINRGFDKTLPAATVIAHTFKSVGE